MFPANVLQIKKRKFCNCKNLGFIDFSSNSKLTVIKKHAFYETKLTTIFIPSSVKDIDPNAFYYCLLHVEIGENSNLRSINE